MSEAEFRARLTRLEQWLWEHTVRLGLARKPPTDEALARAVLQLSDLYTTDRGDLAQNAASDEHLAAKALYFMASDAPKVYLVMRELAARGAAAGTQDPGGIRLLDIGAGVGASVAGFVLALDARQARQVQAVGVDQSARALHAWQAVAQQAGVISGVRVHASTRLHDARLPITGEPPFAHGRRDADWLVAQAVINELRLGDAERAAWMESWAERARTSVVIEPALRATTRPLHETRDRLLATGRWRVLAPCPHQQRCPMLVANDRDWCHETAAFTTPPRTAAIQSITRRRDERTKFSFVVLARREANGTGGAGTVVQGRLVSDPLSSKGKTERVVCTADGTLVRLRLLDKDRVASNEVLASATRGALVEFAGDAAMPRLTTQTVVRVLGVHRDGP